jgi:hypothetical protein
MHRQQRRERGVISMTSTIRLLGRERGRATERHLVA